MNSELRFRASRGDAVAFRRLVAQGADVNAESHDGMTPLLYAIRNRHLEVVKVLIELGANTNKVTVKQHIFDADMWPITHEAFQNKWPLLD